MCLWTLRLMPNSRAGRLHSPTESRQETLLPVTIRSVRRCPFSFATRVALDPAAPRPCATKPAKRAIRRPQRLWMSQANPASSTRLRLASSFDSCSHPSRTWPPHSTPRTLRDDSSAFSPFNRTALFAQSAAVDRTNCPSRPQSATKCSVKRHTGLPVDMRSVGGEVAPPERIIESACSIVRSVCVIFSTGTISM